MKIIDKETVLDICRQEFRVKNRLRKTFLESSELNLAFKLSHGCISAWNIYKSVRSLSARDLARSSDSSTIEMI